MSIMTVPDFIMLHGRLGKELTEHQSDERISIDYNDGMDLYRVLCYTMYFLIQRQIVDEEERSKKEDFNVEEHPESCGYT